MTSDLGSALRPFLKMAQILEGSKHMAEFPNRKIVERGRRVQRRAPKRRGGGF